MLMGSIIEVVHEFIYECNKLYWNAASGEVIKCIFQLIQVLVTLIL